MQDSDNPFGDGDTDKTLLRPSPGGRFRAAPPPEPALAVQSRVPLRSAEASVALQGDDSNPLLAASTPLIALAGELRKTAQQDNPSDLFNEVMLEIQRFEQHARNASIPAEVVLAARYTLCTLLDEVVLGTPWGGRSVWAEKTLLSTFHNDGWGGEKVFQLIDRTKPDPVANIDLLELFYVCLSLGFEGKYRLNERGRVTLDAIRTELYQLIRMHRGEHESALSPCWQGVVDQRAKLAKYVPLWLLGLILVGVSLLAYTGILYRLNGLSDPVMVELASLGKHIPKMTELRARQPVAITPAAERIQKIPGLRTLLAAQVSQGLLEIVDVPGGTRVVLHGDGLFGSGLARINPQRMALLEQVGNALSGLPGQILITGHSDDVPIRTLRYPSNWHLSKARAESVSAVLADQVSPGRLVAEPRAENEPLVANDSPANRARNRRVEVTLFSG